MKKLSLAKSVSICASKQIMIVIDYNQFNKIRIYESISNEINKKGSCFLIAEYQLMKENNNGDKRSSVQFS